MKTLLILAVLLGFSIGFEYGGWISHNNRVMFTGAVGGLVFLFLGIAVINRSK